MDIKKLNKKLDDIKLKMQNVPFGQSQFQIVNFGCGHETETRNYRHALLQLDAKIKAMKECEFRRARKEIDKEEKTEKLNNVNISDYEKRRLEIDIQEIDFYLNEENKLIKDCVIEIMTYINVLDSLPDFSREDFEKQEKIYWQRRMMMDAQAQIECANTVDKETLKMLEKTGIKLSKQFDGRWGAVGDNIDALSFLNDNKLKYVEEK